MLISFQIENFRSFGPEQELSAVANTKQKNLEEHLVEVPGHDEKLVPVIAIYGANGAGKSNLIGALGWLLPHLVEPSVSSSPLVRTRNAFVDRAVATKLVLRFLADDGVYEYGMEAMDEWVSAEWLSSVAPSGQERVVFERATDEHGKTQIEFGKGLESRNEKLRALQVLGVPPGLLFLARIWSELSEEELPAPLAAAKRWFGNVVVVTTGDSYLELARRVHQEPQFRDYVSGFLARVATGVTDLSSEFHAPVELGSLSPGERLRFEKASVNSAFASRVRGRRVLVKLADDQAGEFQLNAQHTDSAGRSVHLALPEESEGTQRLVDLLPAVFEASRMPLVFVIDELDRSLHALLVKEFVREFLSRARGHRNQLIFTTHETHALDQELLRRDEVWFVEKNKDGASQLFSLDDFPVRTDLRLDRGYLMGRFGAVPHIQSP